MMTLSSLFDVEWLRDLGDEVTVKKGAWGVASYDVEEYKTTERIGLGKNLKKQRS